MKEPGKIILYGNSWCGGSRRARQLLEQYGIPYDWVNIDEDEAAAKLVEGINRGYRSVPTLIWPDGSSLTEPSETELRTKLGILGAEAVAQGGGSSTPPTGQTKSNFWSLFRKPRG